jgi:hypothetical protein
MMKFAEDWPRGDVTEPLNRTNKRRVLAQRQMCPHTVVVGGIGPEDLTQVGFAKDDDVIEAVHQELLARNEYLAAENRILKAQMKGRLKLSDAEH